MNPGYKGFHPPDFSLHLPISSAPFVPKRHPITNDYTILTKSLGVGVSGKVLACINKATKDRRALKILRDMPKSRREVDLHWRTCNHPNIVNLKDVYENVFMGHRSLMVVMECMEGGELFDRIQRKGHFTEREAANIIRSICLAVAHLHHLNIAHRDLKPENLLFADDTDTAKLKLTDFGFAKEVKGELDLSTPCYTPYYVAPEVLGPEKYDLSCDVWSIGVITYILLCGYPPFYSMGGAPISPGMKKRIRQGDYSFPTAEWGQISADAKDLIEKLLKTEPKKRLDIDEVLRHPWIYNYQTVPETPLASCRILKDQKEVWVDVQDEISEELGNMRIKPAKLKGIGESLSKNKLLAKRKAKK